MIVDISAEEGYLAEGKTISMDFVETVGEENLIAELTESVQMAVQDTLTERQLSATLEIEVEGEQQDSVVLEPEAAKEQDNPGQHTAKQTESTEKYRNNENAGNTANNGNNVNTGNAENKNTGTQEASQATKEP